MTWEIAQRKRVLKKLSDEISTSEKAIIEALQKDFKKPGFETVLTEISVVQSEIRTVISQLDSWAKPRKVWPSLLNFPSTDQIIYEPYGKVLIISPWNYPFQLAMVPLVSAIAAGNQVVLKPSELSPNTSGLLHKIISGIFTSEQAQVVLGDANVGQELLNQKWDYIFFTGSTRVGHLVAQAAAKNITPTTLELGGKNPCIVDASASLVVSAKRIVWGKFINAGQTCLAPDYLLVHESVFDTFLVLLQKEITKAYGKNPQESRDFCRIINRKHWDRLISLLQNAEIVYGGQSDSDDLFLAPTLLAQPNQNSPLMQEEIFGPILPIIKYESAEKLDFYLTKHTKPLALYVFTTDKSFSQSILNKYSFGGGCINDTLIHFANTKLPFGGIGPSGMGAYHGRWGFETFSHKKPIVKKATWLDIPIRYAPYPENFNWIKKLLKHL
ncbi:aldehyde dehydrogenase [Flavobacterium sp. CYK-55]|uniref:aldehyde dehydrogenase n=1 Tax=Flavobacterium sp. CYK-55 TaxID=2835529 RepID=UPI001BCD03E1|nr:aldehyde dehydrogenase [Flavobacterium sp. CYK-55]MBS7787740.1 aldehyde dehydrogenase [Flavobacterium sp. CYK-55]